MRYLSIDYGLSHIGLAISEGILAETYGQLDYVSDEKLSDEILKICAKEKIDNVIIGISENEMADKTRAFAQKFAEKSCLKVELVDETLTSQEATRIMIESGKKKSDRQKKGHQTAAALILQEYLDSM